MGKVTYSKGKTGMILKTSRKKKSTVISKATSKDVKNMSTKDKLKFGHALRKRTK